MKYLVFIFEKLQKATAAAALLALPLSQLSRVQVRCDMAQRYPHQPAAPSGTVASSLEQSIRSIFKNSVNYSDVERSYRQWVQTQLATQQSEPYELEVRFGTFTGNGSTVFQPNISTKNFYNIMEWFNNAVGRARWTGGSVIKSMSSVNPRDDVRAETFTLSNGTQHTVFTKKQKIASIDNRSYGFRVALAQETPAQGAVAPDASSFVRNKTRWSYETTDAADPLYPFRIDFTKVMSTGGSQQKETVSHEIELELLRPPSAGVWGLLFGVAKFISISQQGQNINEILSKSDIYKVIQTYNGLFSKEIAALDASATRRHNWNWEVFSKFNKPVNVTREILTNASERLAVTDKASGERCFLLVRPNVDDRNPSVVARTSSLFVIHPITSNITIVGYQYQNLAKNNGATVIDCELVENVREFGRLHMLAFDILFEHGQDLRQLKLLERLDHLYRYVTASGMPISIKKFYVEGAFAQRVELALGELLQSYANDGLIFNRIDESYDAEVYKWKPADQMTIDFFLKKPSAPTTTGQVVQVGLYVVNDTPGAKGGLVPFNNETIELPLNGPIELDNVAECLYDFTAKKFKVVRLRLDRYSPNGMSVANKVWADIKYPITIGMLTGREPITPVPTTPPAKAPSPANAFVAAQKRSSLKKLHNSVKTDLIRDVLNGPSILDIGGGRGGDIPKWRAGNKSVLSIEPDAENAHEFYRRMNGLDGTDGYYPNRDTFDISEAAERYPAFSWLARNEKSIVELVVGVGGENFDVINHQLVPRFIERLNGDGELGGAIRGFFDSVTMFNVLTFFFRSEEMLDQLIKTIDANLTKDGLFVGMVMDGRKVRELLGAGASYSFDGEGDQFTINLLTSAADSAFGNKVIINIENSIVTNQVEYLVDLAVLEKKLKNIGVHLVSSNYLSEYAQDLGGSFSESDDLLNGLYTTFVFVRDSTECTDPLDSASNKVTLYDPSSNTFSTFSQPRKQTVVIRNMEWTRVGDYSSIIESAAAILDRPEAFAQATKTLLEKHSAGLVGKEWSSRAKFEALLKEPLNWDPLGADELLPELLGYNILVIFLEPGIASKSVRYRSLTAPTNREVVTLLNDQGDYQALAITDVSGTKNSVFSVDDEIIADIVKKE